MAGGTSAERSAGAKGGFCGAVEKAVELAAGCLPGGVNGCLRATCRKGLPNLEETGSGGWDRTNDLVVNSHPLCR